MTRRWNLGVREVSGLGLRRAPGSGLDELVAISDRSTSVVLLGADDTGRLPADRHRRRAARAHAVRGLPADLDRAAGGSQWEGVAGDAAGRLFVLCERTSELLVLSPGLEFERRIALRHPWRDDAETGLEALLLLRAGHLLAAKQRKPVQLLEFGPAGERPLGLTPSAFLPAGEPARPHPDAELICLATWGLADAPVQSVNDLAVHGGYLYLLSSASHRIARVRLPATEPVRVEGRPKLPGSVAAGRGEHAEGLLVDDRLGLLVAVDSHADRDNLHQLGPSWDGFPSWAGFDDNG